MKLHTGIVLKNLHTHDQGIVILDQYLGKISLNLPQRTTILVGSGTILSYTLTRKRSWYTVENVTLEYMPFESARDDIFFLHHVLELCYYFLPEECAVDEVFHMLIYLMHMASYATVYTQKYLVIARLLSLFGLYPEHDDVLCSYVQHLVDMPLELVFEVQCKEHMASLVHQWVWSCIMAHPAKKQFKTIGLLKKAESHER